MDDHHLISHLTASFSVRSMVLTTFETKSSSRQPIHDRIKLACPEKQLWSLACAERGTGVSINAREREEDDHTSRRGWRV